MRTIEIPDKIKIGKNTYKIKTQKWIRKKGVKFSTPVPKNKKVWGNYCCSKRTIKIRKDVPNIEKVFVHELLHGILTESGIRGTKVNFKKVKNEEKFIVTICENVLNVIKQLRIHEKSNS
jgi:hypothetical protein